MTTNGMDSALVDVGILTEDVQSFEGFVEDFDYDIYRFSLDTPASVSLTLEGLGADADADLYLEIKPNSNGRYSKELGYSEQINTINITSESINRDLPAGTYYVLVEHFFGNVNYTLNLAAKEISIDSLPDDNAGSTLESARDIGTLTQGVQSFSDFIGEVDYADFYQFSLHTGASVSLTLEGLNADADDDADLYLIEDKNGNGQWHGHIFGPGVSDGGDEVIGYSGGSGSSESINRYLSAGTYYVLVDQFSGDTNYTLKIDSLPDDNAGNSLGSARDIGTLASEVQSFRDFVGDVDSTDFYQFSLDTVASVSLTLEGLSADADLYLIEDANGNGQWDGGDKYIDYSNGLDAASESINRSLLAGTYYVLVDRYSGDTNYTLNLAANEISVGPLPADNAGNSLGSARDIGTLTQKVQSFRDFVGDFDDADYYRFSLDTGASVSLTLEGLSADADLFLREDTNGNGQWDGGDKEIDYSNGLGAASESINAGLSAGTYYVLVDQHEGDTNYTLNLAAGDLSSI